MAKKKRYIAASVINTGKKEYRPGETVNLTEEEVLKYLELGMIYEAQEDKESDGKAENKELSLLKETIEAKDEKIAELEKKIKDLEEKIAEAESKEKTEADEPEEK